MSDPTKETKRVFHAGTDGRCTVDEEAEARPAPSDTLEEMTFSAHVVSLHATALLYLGEMPGEDGQALPVEREPARHVIDTLAMLRDKTRGNLTPEEGRLLDAVLYELRMKYVQCA